MNDPEETFRDELLDMEKPDAGCKRRYEKEIQAMFEKELNYLWRIAFAVLSIIGLVVAAPFLHMATSRMGDETLGFFVRLVTVSGGVLALAWTALTAWVAAKGRLNLRAQPAGMAVIGMGLAFFGAAYFMLMLVLPIALASPTDNRSICGLLLALISFFLVAIIGLCLILRVLYRTEFSTREKLLEIEYRLVELGEKFDK